MADERLRRHRLRDRATAYLLENLAVAAVSVLACLAFYKTLVYVVPSDPQHYIRMARGMLGPHSGIESLVRAASEAAPVFPLLLALGIKAGGLFAAYWVNLLFTITALWLLSLLVRNILGRDSIEAMVMACIAWVLVCGNPHNIRFLLLPYREASMFTFVFGGALLMLSVPRRRGWSRYVIALLAGTLFALACCIREAAIIGFAGPLAWVAVWGSGSRRQRAATSAAAISPFLACGLAAFIVSRMTGYALNRQVSAYIQHLLSGAEGGAIFKRMAWISRGYLHSFPRNFTWCGVCLMFAGVWSARRKPAAWLFFLVPALLWYSFYSTAARPQDRYFLRTILLMSVFVGYGALSCIYWVTHWLPKGLSDRKDTVVWSVALVMFLVCFSCVTGWERAEGASRAECQKLMDMAHYFGSPGSSLVVEKNCRMLQAAVEAYCDVAIVPYSEITPESVGLHQLFYIKPLDDRAQWTGNTKRHRGVSAEEYLSWVVDLAPVKEGDERVELHLCGSTYEIYRAVPRSSVRVERQLADRSVSGDYVLWVDFRRLPDMAAARLRLVSLTGQSVWSRECSSILGFKAFFLPTEALPGPGGGLEIVSTTGVPATLRANLEPVDEFIVLSCGTERSVSVQELFKDGTKGSCDTDFAGYIPELGHVDVPVPADLGGGTVQVRLKTSGLVPGDVPATVTYRQNGRKVGEYSQVIPDRHTVFEHEFVLNIEPGATSADVEIKFDAEPSEGNALVIREIALKFQP